MYPHLNPKTNPFRIRARNPFPIVQERSQSENCKQKNRSKKKNLNSKGKIQAVDCKQPRLIIKEEIQRKAFQQINDQRLLNVEEPIVQLSDKYNHLRGKRRSLKLNLILYRDHKEERVESRQLDAAQPGTYLSSIQQTLQESSKCNENSRGCPGQRLSETKRIRSQSFGKVYRKRSPSFMCQAISDSSRKNGSFVKYRSDFCQESILNDDKTEELSNKCIQGRFNEDKKTKKRLLRNKENSYNFISTRTERKQSLFRSKIVDQILENSIDKWDNGQHEQDQNVYGSYSGY